ncbi:UDP-N-acetylglucosamine-N-acetylmuramylpentapeptide N-acetylglucosamine transferase [Pilibacter termitis]|uniref:UDP-N-acetylglucosamine--N-acetylmuramyl-(pentapeptide) pyrophosphoryl-undecaprenol N-acetylglucosamine transferase n=1 Tax=Pilibacter termitis TaxID=263852 RepID=A0A1T4M528_9ENTE|nr:undecaprenyldiphospho-muramoylpentapeptide beta-N-acetylglucosaminyltransferase [Pilibacter termitis]SJZ62021.1 UDP-N-acetylglucosamine-N-acetylmuramylpentapeptide N-acetylglucosamine transferase [Pilibacter termitis]
MRVVVTGGGTGGHIYPALAFVRYLKEIQPDTQVLYIGSKRGLEGKIVPQANIPFEAIEIQGFKRSLSLENLKTVKLFLQSIRKAKRLLRDFQPDVVIGTGGYVSGSVVYAAAKMNIPTLVHEQNSVPGVTNKFLSRYANVVATSFHGVEKYFPKAKVVYTGNPRAQEVAEIEQSDILSNYGLKLHTPTAVVFGGSQGALKINQAMLEALPLFKEKDYQVLYASGVRYFEKYEKEFIKAQKEMENVRVFPYINEMPEVLASATLLVGRSGATSLAEMTALGLPAILIPSPYVTNDHQTKNAQTLVEVGAAELVADVDLTGELLVKKMDEILLNRKHLSEMSAASLKEGVPDASVRLLHLVEEITRGK